jgi:NAD(P)-dependent dehydrogenase (short-subunit alcohol dehydrogenase family)
MPETPARRLDGKVAIITGCAKGQGRAAALLFAAHGAHVAGADWDEEAGQATIAECVAAGGSATFAKVDVSHAEDVYGLVASTVEGAGGLDVLYNNAGISFSGPLRTGTVLDIPEEDWDGMLRINLNSVYYAVRAALPHLIERGGGSIINTASTNAVVGMVNNDSYTAAKGGVLSLTRSLAVRFGKHNIRVNSIIPGPIATDMIKAVIAKPGAREATEAMTALRRIGRPEEVAHAALFLASDESSFVTGSALTVDGGQTAI